MRMLPIGALGALSLPCLLVLAPLAAHADTLEITIRAFVPDAYPGDAGPTARIKNRSGQSVAVLKSPADPDSCYVTDQRGFSAEPGASARFTSRAVISFLDGPARIVASSAASGATLAVECGSGSQTCFKAAANENHKWGSVSETQGIAALPVDFAGADLCLVPQNVVPSIRYKGEFRLNTVSGKLSFKGEVSKFPAIEAFAVYDNGPPAVLFQEPAEGTVSDIASLRPVETEIALPIYEGTWRSTDPAARFELGLKGEDYVFTERSPSGASLERRGKVETAPDGTRVIRRANDAEVLKFLEFSPPIIEQVTAIGPEPSILAFRRSGRGLLATWSGLLVIKNMQGKFKEMKQPGQGPVKPYEFVR